LRQEANGVTTFDDLVDQVSSRVSESGSDTVQDRERLALQLQHTHLPKLADHGVVEFEQSSGVVRYNPDAQVETVLDSLPGEVSRPIPDATVANRETSSFPDR
jgi:hypothetical protein